MIKSGATHYGSCHSGYSQSPIDNHQAVQLSKQLMILNLLLDNLLQHFFKRVAFKVRRVQ